MVVPALVGCGRVSSGIGGSRRSSRTKKQQYEAAAAAAAAAAATASGSSQQQQHPTLFLGSDGTAVLKQNCARLTLVGDRLHSDAS